MNRSTRRHLFFAPILIIAIFLSPEASPASGELLVAYGGHNETMAPIWVGVDRGLFRKHGVDPRVLQTRSGPIMMATLASGGAPLVWAAPTSAISAALGGMRLGCFAVGNDRIPRELIAARGSNRWMICAVKPSAFKASAAASGWLPWSCSTG